MDQNDIKELEAAKTLLTVALQKIDKIISKHDDPGTKPTPLKFRPLLSAADRRKAFILKKSKK